MKRYTRERPCPVCGGFDGAPRGQSVRCFGFLSGDGAWAHCTREEHAGSAPYHENSQTWAHKLAGPCKCGRSHDGGAAPDRARNDGPRPRIVAIYDYRDEQGKLLFQVLRKEGKQFVQRRPDGKSGWIWNLEGVRRVLYRLPELVDSRGGVFIVEGEKDVDRLRSLGLTATTNPGGAGNWRDEYAETLAGRHVCIIPDADDVGRKHAQAVARSLHNKAKSVRVLELPWREGESGKDASDWIDAGHTADELRELAREARLWKLAAEEAEPAEVPCAASAVKEAHVALPEPAGPPAALVQQPQPVVAAPDVRYRPFPVNVLPPKVRRFVVEGAEAIGCPPAFVALPTISMLASAIGNARRLALKSTFEAPPIIWTCVVADSGTKKTAAISYALGPLRKQQILAFKEYDKRLAEYKVTLRESTNRSKKDESAAGEPPEPTLARYVVKDATVEAIGPVLAANPRGCLSCRGELAGWLGSFNQYKKGRTGNDVQSWLEFWDGELSIIDRKGAGPGGPIRIPRAAVCVAGGIQRSVLRNKLKPELFESGLVPRLLLAMPPPLPMRWSEAVPENSTGEAVEDVVASLLSLSSGSATEPVQIGLTPEAKAAWVDFENTRGAIVDTLEGNERAVVAKLIGYAARFVLVIHEIRVAEGEYVALHEVDIASVRAGIALSDWFRFEARRVHAMLQESPQERELREIERTVRDKGGRVTPREMARSRHKYRAAGGTDLAREDLCRLEDAGRGYWDNVPSPTGTRFQETFILFPVAHDGDRSSTDALESPDGDGVSLSPPSHDEEREAGGPDSEVLVL